MIAKPNVDSSLTEDYCNVEIYLLPCGHAFHASCLLDTSCSICMEAAFMF